MSYIKPIVSQLRVKVRQKVMYSKNIWANNIGESEVPRPRHSRCKIFNTRKCLYFLTASGVVVSAVAASGAGINLRYLAASLSP